MKTVVVSFASKVTVKKSPSRRRFEQLFSDANTILTNLTGR